MAGSGLLALLDDIATLLDDVSVMGKIAAKKTAGMLGDDLSLNAQQVTGVRANRELPIVWRVALGSLLNKVILVPLALLISAWAPWIITPLLMAGGAFLCFEGVEKVLHSVKRESPALARERQQRLVEAVQRDPAGYEKMKVRGAIRTDFILSAEIITITLDVVSAAPLLTQVLVLCCIALLVTVGVYGVVALIVKLDDVGFWLRDKSSSVAQAIGRVLIAAAPWIMKVLTVVGTLAMFLVGGGILTHGIPALHHWVEHYSDGLHSLLSALISNGVNLVLGFIVGMIVLGVVQLVAKLRRR